MIDPAAQDSKPQPLPVIAGNLPAELRSGSQFVCWSYTWSEVKAKWDKPPLSPHGLFSAKPNDPSTWGTFSDAIGHYYAGAVDGIGIVPVDDGAEEVLVGIDFDKCRNAQTGEVTPWADGWIKALDTYGEVSPSGTGVRLFAWGRLPPAGRKRGAIEMY